MNNILVMIRKQMKDTFKNKAVLIQLILLPVVSLCWNGSSGRKAYRN